MLGSTGTVEPRAHRSTNARAGGIERWLVGASCLGACLIASCLSAAPARAYSEPRSYDDFAELGGGGGRWFTASPAEGHGCSVCHSGGGKAKLEITGLPSDGYALAATYEVSLSWPEFAARAEQLRMVPDVELPSMGLVAEVVSESGLGAGRIELIPPALRGPAEQCQMPGASAGELYQVRPGEKAKLKNDRLCDAFELGQRCLIAVVPCGAAQIRFRWSTPAQSVGPVWFAAGLVTSDAVSGSPAGDAVLEVTSPMLPGDSSADRYESTLQGGCRVALAAGAARTSSRDAYLPFGLGAGLFAWRVLGARRRRMAARKGRA